MRKRWILHETDVNESLQKSLAKELSCDEVIAKFLLKKDITTAEDANKFFKPKFEDLHSPWLFSDMKKAVDRIQKAISNHEKIIIYGDYDVDGTTATSILLLGLRELNANVDYYIPNRISDGYGMSETGNAALTNMNVGLVITVDCGIDAVDEINELSKMGIDVIITDHHTPKEILPEAHVIIDAKLKNCPYPFSELAGAGVAFKVLQALFLENNRDNIIDYIDLAGLGTIADIVPLTGENRIIATLAIDKLEERKNIGLKYLMNLCGLKEKKIRSSDVVFKIAPRINAAGRLSSADRAVNLLTTDQVEKAKDLALSIHTENTRRQAIDQKTFQEARDMIEVKYDNLDDVFLIVLASENWHPGVVGIVASKIVEHYNRPNILITIEDGEGRGSGRSIAGFNLFDCLSEFQDYLISFGGHKYAAGLAILPEYIPEFEKKLNEYAKNKMDPDDIIPQIRISEEIQLDTVNNNFIQWLKLFAPFGPRNMSPVFMSNKVQIVGYPYTVGTNHLKMKVKQNYTTLDCIGFNMGELAPFLKKGSFVDIAYSLEENEWRNIKKIQAKLKDIRPHNAY